MNPATPDTGDENVNVIVSVVPKRSVAEFKPAITTEVSQFPFAPNPYPRSQPNNDPPLLNAFVEVQVTVMGLPKVCGPVPVASTAGIGNAVQPGSDVMTFALAETTRNDNPKTK